MQDIAVVKIYFITKILITIQLGSVRLPICNMYELLLTYCYSTKNFKNYAFVSLSEEIFAVKYNPRYSNSALIYI